jgi:hypothetical protein
MECLGFGSAPLGGGLGSWTKPTYRVRGRWCCLYGPNDRNGDGIDTSPSEHRGMMARQGVPPLPS